ncbi:UNVERIFIED_CONTAM: hypothetical protein PYX00_002096 [Menopon gallinae]|uniref:Uncharacterized protein n=1 Tax=Menopon gallinae TaxID=328185 RepID=A0AAW2IF97_9NEOP
MEKPKPTYSYDVLVGEWYERKVDEEQKLAMYLKKKERGQLLITRLRRLFANMLKEVQLSLPTKGLTYGGIIQVLAPDVISTPPTVTNSKKKGLVLAVTIQSTDIDTKQDFEDQFLLIGSPETRPCARNSFYIVPEDEQKVNQPVCYGDVFYLRCAANTEVPLYVEAPLLSPSIEVGKSGYPVPRLALYKGSDTRFRVTHLNEDLRMESIGAPVAPFQKVLIVHAPVNVPLCVENDYWHNSLFSPECEISIRSTRNYKKEYDIRNQWVFTVGALV